MPSLKFMWQFKSPWIVKWSREKKLPVSHVLISKLLFQNHRNQDNGVLTYRQTYRSVQQIRESRNKLFIHGQIIFNKGSKTTQWGQDSIFHKWCKENWMSTSKNWIWTLYLTLYTKIKCTKCIKMDQDLNVRLKIIKLLENICKSYTS